MTTNSEKKRLKRKCRRFVIREYRALEEDDDCEGGEEENGNKNGNEDGMSSMTMRTMHDDFLYK